MTLDWQGLTPTIILVRVSMGLSIHDKKTMADATSTMMRLYPPEADCTDINDSKGSLLY